MAGLAGRASPASIHHPKLLPASKDGSKYATTLIKESGPNHLSKFNIFYTLVLTTTIACLLVAANLLESTMSSRAYQLVITNRASVQIIVQILANLLGLIHVTSICRLINYTTRIRFRSTAISLDELRAWIALSMAQMDWGLPMAWLLPLVVFITLSVIPSALWTGAITPVYATKVAPSSHLIPNYDNVSYITEYPTQLDSHEASPLVRNVEGLFSYNVAVGYLGNLLFDAASATVSDGSQRQHAKFDNTRYTYVGRSYGVGSTVGLGDKVITSNSLATGYAYQEVGYSAQVTCIYNMSNTLRMKSTGTYLYAVTGYLPDSPPDEEEYTNCVGTDDSHILVVSVSAGGARRYLAITAGSAYKTLDATQCAIDFTPMLFNISVGIVGRNISVLPAGEIIDFNPNRNLTRTLMRQFSNIAAVETNFYSSVYGNALNASIAWWKITHPESSSEAATLAGLEQAFQAMADDILVAFGSAQFVVGNFSQISAAIVHVDALRFGSPIYIYAIFTINALIVLIFAVEAIRTQGWKKLILFNYVDSRTLVVGSSMGGRAIYDSVLQAKKSVDGDIGRILVKLQNQDELVAIQYAGIRESGYGLKVDKYLPLSSDERNSMPL